MRHYHIYTPFVFPVGSSRVERYDMVARYYEVRMTANRHAREYDVGAARAMVRQCDEAYCTDEAWDVDDTEY